MLTMQAVAAAAVGTAAELATPAAAMTVAALGSLLATALLFGRLPRRSPSVDTVHATGRNQAKSKAP